MDIPDELLGMTLLVLGMLILFCVLAWFSPLSEILTTPIELWR